MSETKNDHVNAGMVGASVAPNQFFGPGHDGCVRVPIQNRLHQNVPNPFKPVTTDRFDLSHSGHVSLLVYDVAGRLVRRLIDEPLSAGRSHRKVWGWHERKRATGRRWYLFLPPRNGRLLRDTQDDRSQMSAPLRAPADHGLVFRLDAGQVEYECAPTLLRLPEYSAHIRRSSVRMLSM